MKRKRNRQPNGKLRSHSLFAKFLWDRGDWKKVFRNQDALLRLDGPDKLKARAAAAKAAQGRAGVWMLDGDSEIEISEDVSIVIETIEQWWYFQPYACGGIAIVRADGVDIARLPVTPCPDNLVWATIDGFPGIARLGIDFADSNGMPLELIVGVLDSDGGVGLPLNVPPNPKIECELTVFDPIYHDTFEFRRNVRVIERVGSRTIDPR